MDSIMNFAKKQLEERMEGGGQQQQQQGGNQYSSQQGYGGEQNYGNEQQSGGYGNEQQGYGNEQQGYGNEQQGGGGYGNQQQSYGNQQQGYGDEQQGYGNEQQGGGGYGNQEYSQGGQGGYGVTGGPQYNAPHGSGGAGGGGATMPSINQNAALEAANAHAGNGNENASMFSQAFSAIQGMRNDDTDVDEDNVQQQHAQAYSQGNAGNMDAGAMGSAAAMQALKQYTSGQSGANGQQSGGGDFQSKIIGMAMSEAAKLFDQSGGAAQGNKQDAMSSAGQTIMKLMLKNQVSGMMGGGQSGGLSSLMGMATKFM